MTPCRIRLSPTVLRVERRDGGRVLLGDALNVPVVLNRTAATWMDLVLDEQVQGARREILTRYNDADPAFVSAVLDRLVSELTTAGILEEQCPRGPAGKVD